MSRRRTDVLRYAEALGYVDEGLSGRGHRRLRHRHTGNLVFVSSTPDSRTTVTKTKALLKRKARSRKAAS